MPPDAGVAPQTSPAPQPSSLPALDDSLPPQNVPTTLGAESNPGKQHQAPPEIGALDSDNSPARTDNQGGGGGNGTGWEAAGGGDGSATNAAQSSGPSTSAPGGGGGNHISVASAKGGAKGGSVKSATPSSSATSTNIADTLSPKGVAPIGPLPTTTSTPPTTNNTPSTGDSNSFPGHIHDDAQPQLTTISIPTDTLDGWSITQNGGSPTGQGTVFLDSNTLLMHEGDSFDVIASYNVVIPQNPGTLTFRYQNLDFDPTGSSHEINDALEASFVDNSGNSLVPTFAAGRDAFFNVTKGQAPALGSSTTFDSSTDRISLDISSLTPGSVGTLSLRLVNNDNTTNTTVQIVGDTVAPGVTAQLLDDTAPAGAANSTYTTDGVTTDPTMTGTLTGSVSQLLVQQDNGAFQDISSTMSGSTFVYTPSNLTPGSHQFVFKAVAPDATTGTATVSMDYDLGPTAVIAGETTTTTGSTLTFDGSASTTDDAPIYLYSWSLPGGTTASGPTASFNFTAAGQYTVGLKVTDIAGAVNSVSETITVNNVPLDPVIGGAPSIPEGVPYLLTLSTNPAADPVTGWSINWGDGSPIDDYPAGSTVVSHTYANPSPNVTISGTATNDNGMVDTNQLDVAVTYVPPTIAIAGPSTIPDDTQYLLNLTAIDVNAIPLSSWTINWGDNTGADPISGNPSSAVHTYTSPGNYTISAQASDNTGTYDSNRLPITVTPAALAPAISGNPTVNEGDNYTLNLSVSNPDQQSIDGWVINWGDGTGDDPVSGNPSSVVHVFANAGSYQVTASVSDSTGTYYATPLQVTANMVPPTVTISGPSTVNEDATYTLNLSATGTVPDHPIQSWLINWGDGTAPQPIQGDPSTANYSYANPDTYPITAWAITNESSFQSNPISVIVEVQPPTVAISGAPTVDEDATYTLNLSATGVPTNYPITGWVINWGDGSGNQQIDENPSSVPHVYTAADVDGQPYTITATAINDQGSFQAIPLNVDVLVVAPTVTISGNSTVNEDATYTLNLSHSGTVPDHPIQSWTINWGDGSAPDVIQTDATTATHVYQYATLNNPPYQITATASTNEATFNASAPVDVTALVVPPTVTISGNPTVYVGATYTLDLSATGQPADRPITGWEIYWGDSPDPETIPYDASSAPHVYTQVAQDDSVYAVAIDADGTFTSNYLVVSVQYAPPTVTISGPPSVNEGSVYTLNLSAYEPGPDTISSWYITWGDGDTTTVNSNPSSLVHTYQSPGPYQITASASDQKGNWSSNPLDITVNLVPPTLTISGPSNVDEGSLYTLNLAASEPAVSNRSISMWTITWGDGSVQTVNGNPSTVTHYYPMGPANETITATATDQSGTYSSNPVGVNVIDVAPTVDAGSTYVPLALTVGSDFYSQFATFTDPSFPNPATGAQETFVGTINWGDGSPDVSGVLSITPGSHGVLTSGIVGASHVYSVAGAYTVTVTVTDSGGASGVDTTTAQLAPVYIGPLPGNLGTGDESTTITGIDNGTSTGSSATTSDQNIVIEGTSAPNTVITVSRSDLGVIGTTTSNANGFWAFNYTGTTLANGNYDFTASAAPLGSLGVAGQFNAFIFGDDSESDTDAEGRVAVGGDATLSNYGVGDALANSNGARDDLIVGGQLDASNGQVYNGNVVYGSSDSLDSFNVPNGTVRQDNVVDFSGAAFNLKQASLNWASESANGTVSFNNGSLVLTGDNSAVNVFDVPGSDLSTANGVTVGAPAGSMVLINVSGTGDSFPSTGVTLVGVDRQDILWNFSEAASLTVQGTSVEGISVEGSVLAPYAAVSFSNGNIEGTLVAAALSGNGELQNYPLVVSFAPEVSQPFSVTVDTSQPPDPFTTPKFFVPDASEMLMDGYSSGGALLTVAPLNAYDTAPLGVAANTEGNIQWVIDANDNVFEYSSAGTLLGRWSDSSLEAPAGIATDGTNIWLLDSGTRTIDYFAGGANFTYGDHAPTATFALNSGNSVPSGLTERDNTLWVTDAGPGGGRVFVYSTNGNSIGEWGLDPADTDPIGITVNPTAGTDIWTVDAGTLTVYDYHDGTTFTLGNYGATSTFPLDSGDTNPGGIADPGPGGTSYTWIGGTSGSWNTSTNWSPTGIPGSEDAATIPSGDTVIISGASESIYSMSVSGTLLVEGETLTIATNSSVSGNLTLEVAGTLNNAGNLQISGTGSTFDWVCGTIEGSGEVTVASNGTFDITYVKPPVNFEGAPQYSATHFLDQALNNSGTLNFGASGMAASPVTANSSGAITNESGGLVNFDSSDPVSATGTAPTFTNDGTIDVTEGTSSTSFGLPFVNAGTFAVQSGTFAATAAITNQSTVTIASGTTLSDTGFAYSQTGGSTTVTGTLSSNQTVSISQGTLAGTGTLSANLSNAANIQAGNLAGTSPGTLTISGNYTQTSAGTLTADVTGTTAGSGYSQVAVTGTVSLGGSLTTNINYTNHVGDNYELINDEGSAAESGTFSGLPQGGTYQIGPALYEVSYTGGTGNDFVVTTENLPDVWTGGATGSWNTASNWSKGTVPASSDVVIINSGSTVTLSSGSPSIDGLILGGALQLQSGTSLSVATASTISGTLTVGVGASLTLSAATSVSGTLVMEGNTLTNAAALTVTGTFDWYDGTLSGAGSTSISSGGTLAIADGSITSPVGRVLEQALDELGHRHVDRQPFDHRDLQRSHHQSIFKFHCERDWRPVGIRNGTHLHELWNADIFREWQLHLRTAIDQFGDDQRRIRHRLRVECDCQLGNDRRPERNAGHVGRHHQHGHDQRPGRNVGRVGRDHQFGNAERRGRNPGRDGGRHQQWNRNDQRRRHAFRHRRGLQPKCRHDDAQRNSQLESNR